MKLGDRPQKDEKMGPKKMGGEGGAGCYWNTRGGETHD